MSDRDPNSPKAWANFLVRAWGPHFPIGVRTIALEYSRQRFPDPIDKIAEAEVESFEGALYPLRKKGGWAILYNPAIPVPGRINFTIGHELGHYLNHRFRVQAAEGFECSQQRVLGYDRDAELRRLEEEADVFASYLLMPMDDFRRQVAGQIMTIELLGHCANRYGVSFTAAARKWIEFTEERAVLVVGRDGFVLWARSSKPALASGVYFRSGTPLPDGCLAVRPGAVAPSHAGTGVALAPGIWTAREPTREMVIFADLYDLTISLLVLPKDAPARRWGDQSDEEDGPLEDSFDWLSRGFIPG